MTPKGRVRSHGPSGYNYGCRCEICTAALRERKRRNDVERRARLAIDPSLAPHGSTSTYTNWGCRCAPCAEANSEKCRRYHALHSRAAR